MDAALLKWWEGRAPAREARLRRQAQDALDRRPAQTVVIGVVSGLGHGGLAALAVGNVALLPAGLVAGLALHAGIDRHLRRRGRRLGLAPHPAAAR